MPCYPGKILYQFRLELPRPRWANFKTYRRLRTYDICTLRDMTAMINYCLKQKGVVAKRLPWRTYEDWEQNTFPEWFRMSIIWMHPDIRELIAHANEYELLRDDEYERNPILRRANSVEELLENVKIRQSL
jgi:hypothetical protein